ncbi:sensor histidine kinase [Belnapia sp. T6]|uniref:histidine kinase n=1 Tax=Belnapia mucosa TaxID=2804532 RepID=A0ABS1UX90_9PROT|nr:sensor histidine kinase [Belnapia mucosa]MBL6454075.1 sensor histidine kinase [Belnapia mucosa]
MRGLLALAFGLVALLAVAGTTLLTGREATIQAREDAIETLHTFARGMADRLDRGMFERWRDIRILATDPVLSNPTAPLEARRAVLRRVQESYPDYAILAFIEPGGRVLVDSRKLAEGADASARSIFIKAKVRPVVEDVHEAIVLARLLPRQVDGLPPRFIDIAAPVISDDGDLVGVVAGHLYWQWAEDIARQFREAVGPVRLIEPMIVSSTGNVLLGPENLQGKPLPVAAALPGPARWPNGQEYLTTSVQTRGYLDYPGLGWSVVVRQPIELATAKASHTISRIVVNGLLAALLAAPIGWLLASWIARPLRVLAATSERAHLLGDDVHFPSGTAKAPYQEARTLAGALGRLVGGLREGQQTHAMLIREADHRLKNSLQTVAAILVMQARRTNDPLARSAFDDAIARVRTVAEVHRALYRADGLPGEQVNLCAMLSDLCRQHAAAALRPGIEIECEPSGSHMLEGRRAMAIGLLVAELVTNAGKHAFPGDRMGTVRVALSERGEGLELVVEDDGVGLAEGGEAGTGLGSILIGRLARQAGGELAIASKPGQGTRVVVRLPQAA